MIGAAAATRVRAALGVGRDGPHTAPHLARWMSADGERSGDLVHDPYNLRLKLFDLEAADASDASVAFWRDGMGANPDLYTKLVVYARPGAHMAWVTSGYLHEGVIAGYFADGTDAHLWAAFGDDARSDAPRDAEHDATVSLAAGKAPQTPPLPAGFTCRLAGAADAEPIARLMSAVFPDYPTPIGTDVIAGQLASGSHRFRVMVDQDGNLAASASAEIDHARRNAEMTDCATRPDQRGAGHMAHLLHRLEDDLARGHDIRDLYTLARADEVGMNCVFGKLGYIWTGRLVNNCRMPNGWESMNVWCKRTDEMP